MSSVFELCLLPIIPSATIAESRDSIAPKIAIVIAGEIKPLIISKDISGISAGGKFCGNEPKREPIVSTGISNIATTAVAMMMTTKEPGILVICFCQIAIKTMERMPKIVAASEVVDIWLA